MNLEELLPGQRGIIIKVRGRGVFRKRLLEMGFIPGKRVEVIKSAPLRDPVEFRILDSNVSLRRAEARQIEILAEDILPAMESQVPVDDSMHLARPRQRRRRLGRRFHSPHNPWDEQQDGHWNRNHSRELRGRGSRPIPPIEVALVGNPNCGKTSIFNIASHSREHTANYSGVTVDSKEANLHYGGYSFRLTDLPGTYSLTSYSPEELFVIRHLTGKQPDVVINVVDATNLERNLYLTTQLIDMDLPVVMALNMFDEFEEHGDRINHSYLGKLLGIPIVPTVGSTGKGVDKLFTKVIAVSELREKTTRHIHIVYNPEIEISIKRIQDRIWQAPGFSGLFSSRFIAIKLLERNHDLLKLLDELDQPGEIINLAEQEIARIEGLHTEDIETLISDSRFGFIAGALKETLTRAESRGRPENQTTRIDRILTHKWLGFPIFLLFLWVMFQSTFNLGQYPVGWIEGGVAALSKWVFNGLAPGMLRDLLVDGIIGGVGGVLVFLPNILILFLFISFMEDTGYMARVAFIMDKLMHLIGLHGKSFIPLIMGFGCNVPAILATRTIENRGDRLITMLILPLMSCSARLPVYILVAGLVFPGQAGNTIFLLYLTGVALSILLALLFKSTIFRKKETPFVMELPPYRIPTTKAVMKHMWFRSQMYLRKMGGVILVASVIIWALGYFPRSEGTKSEQLEASAIGRIGHFIEPVLSPLGFDWKMSVALLSGVTAKEVVVSTLGVLYQDEDTNASMQERMMASKHTKGKLSGQPVYSARAALAFMLFVLIYVPCIAVLVAIRRESGSWKWSILMVILTTALAWGISWIGYQVM
ncbi:MAG: ferrous iron transport protein B [Bacteroidales bacterium]